VLRATHGFECGCKRCAAHERYSRTHRRWESAAEYSAAASGLLRMGDSVVGAAGDASEAAARAARAEDSQAALDETAAYLALLADLG
jgi:hypothetical protein